MPVILFAGNYRVCSRRFVWSGADIMLRAWAPCLSREDEEFYEEWPHHGRLFAQSGSG